MIGQVEHRAIHIVDGPSSTNPLPVVVYQDFPVYVDWAASRLRPWVRWWIFGLASAASVALVLSITLLIISILRAL